MILYNVMKLKVPTLTQPFRGTPSEILSTEPYDPFPNAGV